MPAVGPAVGGEGDPDGYLAGRRRGRRPRWKRVRMTELVPGANRPRPDGMVAVSRIGPFDLSALLTGADGKVSGGGDVVFSNQPSAPGARLRPGAVVVDTARLRPGAVRVVLVASPEDTATSFGRLPAPTTTVLARVHPPRLTCETVLLLVEIYRRDGTWRLRALGQGYADGLAGLARDFGVEVDDGDSTPTPAAPPSAGTADLISATLARTNAERARSGLVPLTFDPRLTAAAPAHSTDMITRGFVAHKARRAPPSPTASPRPATPTPSWPSTSPPASTPRPRWSPAG